MINIKQACLILLAAVIPVTLLPAEDRAGHSEETDSKVILGSREMVMLSPPGLILESRIDTGAELSSVHGSEIRLFVRDGFQWVSFNLDYDGADRYVELPVQSVIRVLQANSPQGVERPVIRLTVSIGSLTTEADFTITDRRRMSSPVLIGRNVLSGLAFVDVSRDFIQSREQ